MLKELGGAFVDSLIGVMLPEEASSKNAHNSRVGCKIHTRFETKKGKSMP